MANNTIKTYAHINQIFNDLEKYRNFCRDYGYRFNEVDLYDTKNYIYRQFQKFITGKPVKNQWEIDYAKYKEEESSKTRS